MTEIYIAPLISCRTHRGSRRHTLVPSIHDLDRVDNLGVESRCDLDTHTRWKQDEIESSQIRLLVPRRTVIGQQVSQYRLGNILLALFSNHDHVERLMFG